VKWGLTARDVGVAISVALYLLCVTAVGYRIFEGGGHLEHALWLVIIGQAVFLTTLAVGSPRWLAALLGSFGIVVALSHQHAPSSHWYGLPTFRTWEIWTDAVAESTALFNITTAPVPYETGWAGLYGLGVALVVISTLFFGQVLHAHFEAIIPGATFFIFLSVLGDGPSRLIMTLAVITTGYLMAATLRGVAHVTVARLMTTGATIAVIGAGVAPYFPGADQEPWITTKGRFGASDSALSPLVDIQGRLVNQSTVEMFAMESVQPAYWRILTLSEFDGRRFSAPSSPRQISGPDEVTLALAGANEGSRIEQILEISGLEGSWLPAAAVPVAISALDATGDLRGAELRWNPQFSAVSRADRDLLPNDTFLVQSVLPQFSTSELLERQALSPPDPIYISLPESFPQEVIDRASQVVNAATGLNTQEGNLNGANRPYLVARALQDWFRAEFTYSLEIPGGHGNNALERFLEDRVGYCEQFAAAFVAMARSQGLASRVAVGYTPGVQRQPGRYTVQGRHAHAWPEVWFDGLGWVPFEPTPGRGVPGAEDYTGLLAQQDGPLGVIEPGTEDAAGFDALDEIGDLSDVDLDIIDGGAIDIPSSEDTTPAPSQDLVPRILLTALVLLGSIALAGPWIWRRFRSRQLRQLPPEQQVLAMWHGQLGALRRDGFTSNKAMTITDIKRVVEQRIPALANPIDGLASQAEVAGFARDPHIQSTELEQCEHWEREISQILRRRKGAVARAVSYFAVWRDRPLPRGHNRRDLGQADGVNDPGDQNSDRPLARR
jgi:transglutaminase-like putative cysteine protease